MSDARCTGEQFLTAMNSATAWLEAQRDAVNALNVYPVPDGDTGTNMHLTMVAAIKGITPGPLGQVAERIYKNALMGARGNSGVILSQILRGLSQGLAGLEEGTPADLSAAFSQAAATAYKAVMKPVEGTMLTVIRQTAEALQAHPDGDFRSLLEHAVRAAHASVESTPTMLKTLRDAGVVDAGGYGLAVLLEGALQSITGETPRRAAPAAAGVAMAFDDIHGPDDFGYCTNFIVEGSAIPFEEVRATLAEMGTSAVVVGDETLVKVHIHTLRPGDMLNYAIQFGELSAIEITNMDHQRRELHAADDRTKQKEAISSVGVVAVAPGDGFRQIFEGLNVGAVVTGGQTMNPSIQDLVQAIESLPQEAVIVLPNNSNVLFAAERAHELTSKQVAVVPTKTVPQGIAAMLAFNYAQGLEENERMMSRSISAIQTAEITTAVRDATVNDVEVKAGQTIGLLDGKVVESGDDADEVVNAVLRRMSLESCEILSVYYGAQASQELAQQLAERVMEQFPDLEVEIQSGGQPFYDYILSAE